MDDETTVGGLPKMPPVPGLSHRGGEAHVLREIMRSYQALIGAFSRRVGMPAAQLVLVRLLAGCGPEGLGILDIARRLEINAAAVTRMVKGMEIQGLVARRRDSKDRRRSFVGLTPEGRTAFEEVHARSHELERELTASVTDEDIATTTRVLFQIRKALVADR